MGSVWHPGERVMQDRAGVAGRIEEVGRLNIRPAMPEQHRAFMAGLGFAVLGAVEPAGDVWATVRAGPPGFLHAPGAGHLRVGAGEAAGDPAQAGLRDGASVGMLGIDLGTRRRNRVNGVVEAAGPGGFTIAVRQSYGTCPQYIHRRAWSPVGDMGLAERMSALDGAARAMVAAADTFFVASYVDGEDGVLTVPDYAGDRFYNTLGNLLVNGRVGLLFVDFERGGACCR